MKKLNCILLIDDNHLINILNTHLLEGLDIAEHIYAVENGQQGIDYLMKCNQQDGALYPDLILLDLNMPVMNGWEFIEEFKALNKQQCPIIMLTTSPNPDDEKRAEKMKEVYAFQKKPLTEEMISAICHNFL